MAREARGAIHGAALRPKILAVADSYEAMTCDRVYRRAMPATAARDELRCCAGAQFDQHVVEVFVEYLEREESLGRSVLPFTPEQIVGAPAPPPSASRSDFVVSS